MKDKIVIGSIKEIKEAKLYVPKIKNGSLFHIGTIAKTTLKVDQQFNWFQKLMWKWCFGVKVEDYSEEDEESLIIKF